MIAKVLLNRLLPGLLAAFVSFRYGLGIYAWRVSNGLEKPRYTVVEALGKGVELRRYDEYTVAEVTFKKPETMKSATSQGFRKVAGYIFGKNRAKGRGAAASKKMAMTAPVRMALKGDLSPDKALNEVKVSFVMAANETTSTLPVPLDAGVRVQKIPAHYMAAVAFNGAPPSEAKVEAKRNLVNMQLAARNLRAKKNSETLVYGYHDPFITPNILRKNEVGVVVDAP
mmetsp:Transcript_65274/g.131284  ORF Transcript_65274/g.131284 Transcript_65274/m.131284 type:complete len:227 (-) Transcript_65274:105-785(-)